MIPEEALVPGARGRLVIYYAGRTQDEIEAVYGGEYAGAGVTHYLFRSVRGGWGVSVTDVDFECGDAEFEPGAAPEATARGGKNRRKKRARPAQAGGGTLKIEERDKHGHHWRERRPRSGDLFYEGEEAGGGLFRGDTERL